MTEDPYPQLDLFTGEPVVRKKRRGLTKPVVMTPGPLAKATILEALAERPMTDKEIVERTGLSYGVVAVRRAELHRAGRLHRAGIVDYGRGRRSQIWQIQK